MRVLVCGGRNYGDHRPKWPNNEDEDREAAKVQNQLEADCLEKTLSRLDITLLIAGGARGADALAERFAKLRGIPCAIYPVTPRDWGKYGKGAGPRRNVIMLRTEKPELVVAFPGGFGTNHMKKIAREAGVEVMEIADSSS